MTLSDRKLIELARETFGNSDRYHVWVTHHYGKLGRVLGARQLGITEAKWRHELEEAERKMRKVTRERSAA